MIKKIFEYILIFFVFAGCKSIPKEKNILYGIIYDGDNEAISDVSIYVNNNLTTSSDIYGHFSIEKIRIDDEYIFKAEKNGYESTEITISYKNVSQLVYLRLFSGEQLLRLAENKVKEKKYDEALDVLLRSEKAGGSIISINYLRAVIFYNSHKYHAAIESLNKILSIDFQDPNVYLLYADIYQFGLSDNTSAKENLEKYLKITFDPKVEARYNSL